MIYKVGTIAFDDDRETKLVDYKKKQKKKLTSFLHLNPSITPIDPT